VTQERTELWVSRYAARVTPEEAPGTLEDYIEALFGPEEWQSTLTPLEEMALRVRERVLRLAVGGGCFVGSALSCVDLLVYLYGRLLNVTAENLDDPARDYLFLSKGHAVPALYATLVEAGLLQPERLENHLQVHDSIYLHPNPCIPGVEFHAGSLGHLLPVAVGVALECKIRGQSVTPANNRVVVVTGDGELNEGTNWEACLVAAAHHLDNLVIVVDRNHFQANERTEALVPLEPLEAKFEAFGCRTARINGHSFEEMDRVSASLPLSRGRPSVVIADTVRGQGVPSLQERADRWFVKLTAKELEPLIAELHRGAR
jgi:transketolase